MNVETPGTHLPQPSNRDPIGTALRTIFYPRDRGVPGVVNELLHRLDRRMCR